MWSDIVLKQSFLRVYTYAHTHFKKLIYIYIQKYYRRFQSFKQIDVK